MEAYDILKGFLETEINYQEMYQAIHFFLTSFEIREGKFEANAYLLNKLNRETVIVYQEYETPKGFVYSMHAHIFHIPLLLEEIDNKAKKIGLTVVS